MLEIANELILTPSFGIQLEPKTLYLAFHIVSFALGIGAATLLDILVVRIFLFDRVIEDGQFGIISYASKIVALGLLLAWISGGLYLLHICAANPLILENPKFLVKVCVLCVLSLNGAFIHLVVIPHIERRVHQTMFNGHSLGTRVLFLASGSISVVSWYFPVLLGTAKEMNFKVPFEQIVAFYLTLAVLAFAFTCGAKLVVLLWVNRTGTVSRIKASCARLAIGFHREPGPRLVVARAEPRLRVQVGTKPTLPR